jgi:predicted RNA-binding protein with RPS1 domain
VKVVDFGAFVNFFGPKDGLVHISQLANERVAKTTDVVKEGDKVWVKLLGFDERGKVRLSMKVSTRKPARKSPVPEGTCLRLAAQDTPPGVDTEWLTRQFELTLDRLALLVERLPSASIIYSEAGARPC